MITLTTEIFHVRVASPVDSDIDGALRNVMVPVSAEITPADELLYVLTECARLEADWREARRLAHGPILGRLKTSLGLVPKEPFDFSEDILLDLFEKLGYKPSELEILLFISRFGTTNRVSRDTIMRLLEGDTASMKPRDDQDSGYLEAWQKRQELSTPSFPQDAKWVPLLFKSLLQQNVLKERFNQRKVDIAQSFKQLGKERVDPEVLRDLLIVRGVFIPAEDLSHLCTAICGGEASTKTEWGLTELELFLESSKP